MQSQVYQLELDVLYDNKYLEKNDYDDMLDLLWDAENYYFAEFNILIDYDFPDLFNASADIRCTSTECTRLSHPTENAPHHGNFTSYANELCSYQPNADAVLVFSGHVLCDCNEGDTVASPTGGACVPSNSNRSFPVCLVGEYNTPKLLVLIHEIGHLFDAPDHYGEVGAYDTKIMNDNVNNSDHKAYIPNLPMGSKPYNEYCIYGENKNTVSTLTICDGCTYKIRNYISKLIAGTEQIG